MKNEISSLIVAVAIAILLCAGLLLMAGCSGLQHKSKVYYSPPPDAEVHKSIEAAQGSVDKAVNQAKLVQKAKSLKEAQGMIVALNRSLFDAKNELQTAGQRLKDYEKKVSDQTDDLNKANAEKNRAIDIADAALHKYHQIKLYVCLAGAALIGMLVWQFKSILLVIPPPYGIAAGIAAPVLTFGLLWMVL